MCILVILADLTVFRDAGSPSFRLKTGRFLRVKPTSIAAFSEILVVAQINYDKTPLAMSKSASANPRRYAVQFALSHSWLAVALGLLWV